MNDGKWNNGIGPDRVVRHFSVFENLSRIQHGKVSGFHREDQDDYDDGR